MYNEVNNYIYFDLFSKITAFASVDAIDHNIKFITENNCSNVYTCINRADPFERGIAIK